MVLVVPIERAAAEAFGVLKTAKPGGESWPILQGFELAFGERVVVGGVRAVMRAGAAEVSQQQGCHLGLDRPAAIGVHELAGRHVVFGDGIVEQRPEQRSTFSIVHAPAHHSAAENVEDHVKNVEDHVKIEVAPFCWPHQFGDVPRPDLIGPFRQQFGLSVDRMTELLTALADFAVLAEDAVHGADSRRRTAPIPPVAVARSVAAKMRNLSWAVRVRRRGRSDNSRTPRLVPASIGVRG
jgi:hypothetical protein